MPRGDLRRAQRGPRGLGRGFCFPAGLGLCFRLGTGDLLGNHLIDAGIEFGITTFLLVDDTLDGLLLFLQAAHHILLLHLFVLQRFLLLFTTIQQVILQAFGVLEFIKSFPDLSLHRLDGLTLSLFVGGIFTDKAEPTIHL